MKERIPAHDYLQVDRKCDMVMKGGVTSGIVYPLAIAELARSFRLANIGGTSAGAIAAALAAAAEYARRAGRTSGFERLEALPDHFKARNPRTGRSNLGSLFQPQRGTAPLFEMLRAAAARKRGRIPAALRALVRSRPALLLCIVPLIGAIAFGIGSRQLLAGLHWLTTGLVTSLLLFVLCAVLAVWRSIKALPANGYGLCSGFGENADVLTTWLASEIQQVSGKEGAPLTFGDLWGADADARINLEVMTTNVSQGRPYALPFDVGTFYFRPDEMATLFPANVVESMNVHGLAKIRNSGRGQLPAGLLPFPDAADVPIIIAARMSLSFPLLFSAIPLYVVDFSRLVNQQAKETNGIFVPERCWFSDGGISSNFPLHLFDQPIPRWPSFALNLKPFHPDHPRSSKEDENVYVIERFSDGTLESVRRFDDGSASEQIFGFLGAILSTMQNWRDNVQMRVPGFRERIAHVSQDAEEGGLNLDMPDEVITRLAERGAAAGTKLRSRFDDGDSDGDTISWKSHRWARLRSTLSVLEGFLTVMNDAFFDTQLDPTYAQLMREPHSVYEWSDGRGKAAADELSELFERVRGWRGLFARSAPRPEPELRITPRL
jgi:predicted acylesterase/phospholipase RssA